VEKGRLRDRGLSKKGKKFEGDPEEGCNQAVIYRHAGTVGLKFQAKNKKIKKRVEHTRRPMQNIAHKKANVGGPFHL